MERIVDAISLVIFLRTVVRIESRLQCELGDWESKTKTTIIIIRAVKQEGQLTTL